jgi:hypothetical protein
MPLFPLDAFESTTLALPEPPAVTILLLPVPVVAFGLAVSTLSAAVTLWVLVWAVVRASVALADFMPLMTWPSFTPRE